MIIFSIILSTVRINVDMYSDIPTLPLCLRRPQFCTANYTSQSRRKHLQKRLKLSTKIFLYEFVPNEIRDLGSSLKALSCTTKKCPSTVSQNHN